MDSLSLTVTIVTVEECSLQQLISQMFAVQLAIFAMDVVIIIATK